MGRQRPDPRDHAHDGAQCHADEAVEQVGRLQRGLKAQSNICEDIHYQLQSNIGDGKVQALHEQQPDADTERGRHEERKECRQPRICQRGHEERSRRSPGPPPPPPRRSAARRARRRKPPAGENDQRCADREIELGPRPAKRGNDDQDTENDKDDPDSEGKRTCPPTGAAIRGSAYPAHTRQRRYRRR